MKKTVFVGSLLVASVLGAGVMSVYEHYRTGASRSGDAIAENSLAPGSPGLQTDRLPDPVKQMEEMRHQMEQFFNRDDFFKQGGFSGRFGSWFDTAQGAFGSRIEEGEDKKSVFYKIQVGDRDVSDVNVTVEDGYVSIGAEMTNKSNNAYSQSSISQTFPVPPGVDPDSAKIDQEGDAVIVRFNKVS